jgi:DNA repair exonuclease SbcCD ATPase subunit
VAKELKLYNPETAYLYNMDSKEKVKTYLPNSVVDVQFELGDYYLTQYSVTQKVKNGFNKGEWKLYDASEVSDIEKLRNEITRLTQELSAVQKGYDQLSKDLEEKNITIDQLRTQAVKDKKAYGDLEVKMAEKKVVIKRLEDDIKWMEDQEELLKDKITELEKSLETCSQVTISQLSWSEIFSGVLSKLTGKEPKPE